MTLEQLRIFIAVAERQHVTAAARFLNLTQSAVSNAIAALEEQHALKLFDRVGRGIVLNSYGQLFLVEARAVMARAMQAETLLADLNGLNAGTLRVQASQTIVSYWLPRYLAHFHTLYPNIAIDIQSGNTKDVAEATLQGACELGFIEGAVSYPLLTQENIGQDKLTLIAAPNHPLGKQHHITPQDLIQAHWVAREQGSGTRSSLEKTLAKAGCPAHALHISMTLPSNEAVLNAAQNGIGIAGLSEYVVKSALEAHTVIPLKFDLPARHFKVLHHKERRPTHAANAFLAMLRNQPAAQ